MSTSTEDTMPSPCIKVCQLDAGRTYCTACMRTLDEIGGWSQYSTKQKLAVWDRLTKLTGPAAPLAGRKCCEQCGAEFNCGVGGQSGGCWCSDLPTVLPLAPGGTCLCPACLRAHMASEYRKRGLTPPF